MKICRIGVAAAAAGLNLLGGAALAQSTAPTASIEEVVVTATKREEKLHDVAMSITAVTGDELARRSESGFTDFAAQVPGLSFQSIDPTSTRVILRGQNVGSVGATIATTVDDIPFFMSGAQADGAFFSANVDTYDMQRIEVLRGPQGTLYGAAAEGGLIKYVTNRPNLNVTEGAVSLGTEIIDGGQSAAIAKGVVNLPFWDNKAAVRISAVDQGLPGWINDPATGQKNINHGDKFSLRASLLVTPVTDLTIRATVFNQGLTARGTNTVEVVGAAATPLTPPANQFDPVNGMSRGSGVTDVISNNLEYYALNIDYSFSWATLMSATSYGKMALRSMGDITDNNLIPGVTYGAYLGAVAYDQGVYIQGSQLESLTKFNQELRLASRPGNTLFGHGFDWQAGAFFTHETTLLDQPYNALDAANPATVLAPALGGAAIAADYKESAVFADVTYHFTKAFDVELGGRSTSTKQDQTTTFRCCVLYGPDYTFDPIHSSETATTWSVAPRWHASDTTLVYARIATGFRPGGPNIPTPTLPQPPSFLHDTTRNYELGVRSDLFDRHLTIDVAAFDVRWKDVQILGTVDTDTGPVHINGNSGDAESKGLEWNIVFRPLPGLSIGVLGAYTDAKIKGDAPDLGASSGDKLPFVPDVSNTVNLDYNWTTSNGYSAFAGASWTYTGVRYGGFSPLGTPPSMTVSESHTKLPTYNTLRLQIGVDTRHYSVELYGNNMTNARGITDYANQGGSNQTGLATFIQPRTYGLQLGAKF